MRLARRGGDNVQPKPFHVEPKQHELVGGDLFARQGCNALDGLLQPRWAGGFAPDTQKKVAHWNDFSHQDQHI